MQKNKRAMTTKTMVYCALLAALSVVLARLFSIMPEESARFSIESVPIFIAGMLFGPVAGGMVGFTADFVGCMFSPFGYNPIFCIPPILYGVCAGLFRRFISGGAAKKTVQSYLSFGIRLAISLLVPVALGSVLLQSLALAIVYPKGSFQFSYLYFLTTRGVQFAIVYVLDLIVIYLLFTAGIFRRLGLWPPVKKS